LAKERSKFCWRHAISRTTDAPRWYENSKVQTLLAVLGILATWYFFTKGPTVEKQDQGLAMMTNSLDKQDQSLALLKGLNPAQPTNAFRVAAETAFLFFAKPGIWLVRQENGGEWVRHPARTLLWVQLTNIKPMGCMIDSYRVEWELGRQWFAVSEMDMRSGG